MGISIVNKQKPIVVTLPSKLSLSYVEVYTIIKLGIDEDPQMELIIDFSKSELIQPMAGRLIGNSLRRYSAKGVTIVLNKSQGPGTEYWEKNIVVSGLVFYFARYSKAIKAGNDDIIAEIRKKYYEIIVDKPYSFKNIVYLHGLEKKVLDPKNRDLFKIPFLDLFDYVEGQQFIFSDEINENNDMVNIGFEAVQNVYEHAGKGAEIKDINSYLSINYLPESLNILNYYQNGEYSYLSDYWDSRFNQYLENISSDIANNRSKIYQGWIEMVIADDGIGIPRRHSKTPHDDNSDLYWNISIADEQKILETALETGETIKTLTGEDKNGDSGFGFTNIATALKNVSGFAAIRTGRTAAYFDSTESKVVGTKKFRVTKGELNYVPGTILFFIFPRRIG